MHKSIYKENHSLSLHSWFGTGGKAKKFFSPYNEDELIKYLKENVSEKIIVIGSGSNILFRDNGCIQTVIKLGKGFRGIELTENGISSGAAALKKTVSEFAKENLISQHEFLFGIPGTMGGGIFMNAGCFGTEFKDIVEEVHGVTKNGTIEKFNKDEIKFSYRKTDLSNDIIITRILTKASKDSKESIEKKMNEIKFQKNKNQPTRIKTGGSTFKNPDCKFKAWELIKKSGCDHLKIGNVKFSDTHCNFIENSGNSSSDIEKLIDQTINKVKDQFDIILEPEIKIFGEK